MIGQIATRKNSARTIAFGNIFCEKRRTITHVDLWWSQLKTRVQRKPEVYSGSQIQHQFHSLVCTDSSSDGKAFQATNRDQPQLIHASSKPIKNPEIAKG